MENGCDVILVWDWLNKGWISGNCKGLIAPHSFFSPAYMIMGTSAVEKYNEDALPAYTPMPW